MKKADDKIIWKMLDLCRYIKWKNVEDFSELEKNKNKRKEIKRGD